MFEYFMPLLVMRGYPGTLLDETYQAAVQRQIQYGDQRQVPWGISESAYNAQDLERNYQYRAFGVPGLGLKRGLGDDLVIAPYACMLAAMIAPREVVRNLQRLAAEGMTGRYGFYEAIDHTPQRLPKGQTGGVVLPTFMAHHQGMSLLALDNALQRFADAGAVSCRPARAGGRSAAPGTRPAPRPAQESADRKGEQVAVVASAAGAGGAALPSRRTRSARARISCRTGRTPSW